MASLPWFFVGMTPENKTAPGWAFIEGFLKVRLDRMEPVLAAREWLAGSFSIADILMADVLRTADRFDALASYPAARAYVARATARPAFIKAYDEQMARFAAAD
jgi:glutathione S-transferase